MTVPGLDVNPADDGLVVYVAATDTVHHLNKTAGVIFGLCDGTRDASAIAAEDWVCCSSWTNRRSTRRSRACRISLRCG